MVHSSVICVWWDACKEIRYINVCQVFHENGYYYLRGKLRSDVKKIVFINLPL